MISHTNAIILAAGVGRRLGAEGHGLPKCMLEVGGRTLIDRMLEHLRASAGVERAVVVTGYEASALAREIERTRGTLPVELLFNAGYRQGSIVSLAAARRHLTGHVLVMDADVLFHRALLERLLGAADEDCFLLDPRGAPTGEEMMLAVEGGRVRRITRRPGDGWELLGEGVGFARFGPRSSQRLGEILGALVAAGHTNLDYEVAIDQLLAERPAGFVSASDLPWTEIDFPEDLLRASREILPRVAP